jgi:hypothetical protein
MSDRKYRIRGYQDDDRERQPKAPARPAPEPGAPAGARRISQDGPKHVNMPGYREVVRCTQCATVMSPDVGYDTKCPRCGTDAHSCAQCTSFDPKNAKNACSLFSPRTTVERETTTPRNNDARQAFDDLFKF